MSKELTEAVEAVFIEAGVPFERGYGGKHNYVAWRAADGTERKMTIPVSESDWRAKKNAVADAKRLLRASGYGSEEIEIDNVSLVSLRAGQAWCSSLDLAERFSRNHRDVLRAIDKIREECGAEFDQRNFAQITYRDKMNREYRAFDLSRDGFTLVAMGFTGADATAWKVRYIEAFNAMEAEIVSIAVQHLPAPQDHALRADLDALTDIVLSLPPPAQIIRRGPYISPIAIIRQRREKRTAKRSARLRAHC